jgi:ATP-dependent Zn protease
MNESAILSARNNEKEISEKRITESFERIVM